MEAVCKKQETRNIPRLPVNHLTVIGAYNKKPQQVKLQIKLPISIEKILTNIHFLIIPGLNLDIVIGCDVLKKSLAEINFKNEFVKLIVNSTENNNINKVIGADFKQNCNSLKLNIINEVTHKENTSLDRSKLNISARYWTRSD